MEESELSCLGPQNPVPFDELFNQELMRVEIEIADG